MCASNYDDECDDKKIRKTCGNSNDDWGDEYFVRSKDIFDSWTRPTHHFLILHEQQMNLCNILWGNPSLGKKMRLSLNSSFSFDSRFLWWSEEIEIITTDISSSGCHSTPSSSCNRSPPQTQSQRLKKKEALYQKDPQVSSCLVILILWRQTRSTNWLQIFFRETQQLHYIPYLTL